MDDFNATQFVGMAAFAAAAVASVFAAAANRRHRLLLMATATMYALLPIEIAKGERFGLEEILRGALRADQAYSIRRPIQIVALIIIVGVLPVIYHRLRNHAGGAAPIVLAAFAVVVLFVIESVSLHYVDAMLYREIGGVKVIGWCWLALAGTAIVAASKADSRLVSGRLDERERR